MLRVKLDTTQLKDDVLIIGAWVSGEKVKIKGEDFHLAIKDHKSQTNFHDLVGLGNILELGKTGVTFLYFSKGR